MNFIMTKLQCFFLVCLATTAILTGVGASVISSYHVTSHIRSRFAKTLVVQRAFNPTNQPEHITFHVTLPEAALISNFSIEVNGSLTVGKLEDKRKAKKQLHLSKLHGVSTGSASENNSGHSFSFTATVEAQDMVTFNLTYEELLQRDSGAYRHQIFLQADESLNDLRVDVFIFDEAGLSFVKVPCIEETTADKSVNELIQVPHDTDVSVRFPQTVKSSDGTGATKSLLTHVTYAPDTSVVLNWALQSRSSDLQLAVLYDFDRSLPGNIYTQVQDGYFVQFVTADAITNASSRKAVVLVVDRSSSNEEPVSSGKLMQAIKVLLEQLQSDDWFNVITVGSSISQWKSELVNASAANVNEVLNFLDKSPTDQDWNLSDALSTTFNQLRNVSAEMPTSVVLFTEAASANHNLEQLEAKMTRVNNGSSSFNVVSFGESSDALKTVASNNNGLARHFDINADVKQQIERFKSDIWPSLLSNISVTYINNTASEVYAVATKFDHQLRNGDELVILGKLIQAETNNTELHGIVYGINERNERQEYKIDQSKASEDCLRQQQTEDPSLAPMACDQVKFSQSKHGFLTVERMWAYAAIKALTARAKRANNDTVNEARALKRKVTELCLQYNFLTQNTAFVLEKSATENELYEIQGQATHGHGHQLITPTLQVQPTSDDSDISVVSSTIHLRPVAEFSISETQQSKAAIPEFGKVLQANKHIDSRTSMGLKSSESDIHEGCFKTWPSYYFLLEKNYMNSSSSALQTKQDCANECFSNRFCRVALWSPKTKICQFSYQFLFPVCSAPAEPIPDTDDVLLYCIVCSQHDLENQFNQKGSFKQQLIGDPELVADTLNFDEKQKIGS